MKFSQHLGRHLATLISEMVHLDEAQVKSDPVFGKPVDPAAIHVGNEFFWKKGSSAAIVKVLTAPKDKTPGQYMIGSGKVVVEVETLPATGHGEKLDTDVRLIFPIQKLAIVNDYIKQLKLVSTARGLDDRHNRMAQAVATYGAMQPWAQGIADGEVNRNKLQTLYRLAHYGE